MTAPGTVLKGREYDKAVAAIDRTLNLAQTRAETARRAIAAVLAYLGARRIVTATQGGPDGADDRRILAILADIETAAERLDAIPQRSESAEARQEAWSAIADLLVAVKHRLGIDHAIHIRTA